MSFRYTRSSCTIIQKKVMYVFLLTIEIFHFPGRTRQRSIIRAREIYDLCFAWRNPVQSWSIIKLASRSFRCISHTCACIAPLLVLRHTVLAVRFHIRVGVRSMYGYCTHTRTNILMAHLRGSASISKRELELTTRSSVDLWRMVRKLAIRDTINSGSDKFDSRERWGNQF